MRIMCAAPVSFKRITLFISHYMTGMARALKGMGNEVKFVELLEIVNHPGITQRLLSLYYYQPSKTYLLFLPSLLINRRLFLKEIKLYQPEILFIHTIDDPMIPGTIRKVRNLSNCKIVTWCGVHPKCTRPWVREFLAMTDCILIYDPTYISYYEKAIGNAKVEVLPLAHDGYNALSQVGMVPRHFSYDICFIGRINEYRYKYLRVLKDFNLGIWSWNLSDRYRDLVPFYQGQADGDHAVEVMRQARIVLNIHQHWERWGGNFRLFEIPAAGAMQLCDRLPGVKDYFEEDSEIVFFSSPEELREKVNFLLDHPDLVHKIAKRGHLRVRKDHSLLQRCQTFMQIANKLVSQA